MMCHGFVGGVTVTVTMGAVGVPGKLETGAVVTGDGPGQLLGASRWLLD